MTRIVTPQQLREWIVDDGELALLDVREEGVFGADGHLLFAVCVPLSHLEIDILERVPRKSVRLVLCDGGDGLAARAAAKLDAWGYGDISILDGGVPGWEAAGYVVFRGVNVPSKAFGEFVEHQSGTPSVSAEELKAMIDGGDNMVVLDSRPWGEYRRMSIPTGIDCPGAELAYRVHDAVDDPETTIVVNCAGRTRSIIGAQSLINAGVANRVVALRNGTMGWALAGFDLENGAERNFPDVTDRGLALAQASAEIVAKRFGLKSITPDTLADWQAEADTRSLYVLDVRNPAEYEAGHRPGSVSAPGGQLVQATDRWVCTLGARIVLVDDTGIRARMTASWLVQMGWRDVAVLTGGLESGALETGPSRPPMPVITPGPLDTVSVTDLQNLIGDGAVTVVDFATSLEYRAGHIPGAWWAIRARLPGSLGKISGNGPLVFTSPDGILARLAAGDAEALTDRPIKILDGGTAAWRAAGGTLSAGFENMADDNNDVQYKAYDHTENIEFHMQEYLSWEIGLVELIDRDGTARFRHVPA
ncbi:MAG: rhodanese-like domain-containing protein [Proteobacteria bacterium]|nr:rhodanese-like domain-containing protein [Pseudomonadota bacterium]